METLFILGAGGHSKVVRAAIDANLFSNVSLLVQDRYLTNDDGTTNENSVESFEEKIKQGPQNFICAIGSIIGREALFTIAKNHAWLPKTIRHHTAVISKNSQIGEGTYVGVRVIINPDAVIGKNCIVNTGSIVEHDCFIGDHVNISPSATLCGSVKIGDRTLIGAGATILPGIEVGKNCIVGAGAVVTYHVRDSTRVAGVPACQI